MYIIKHYFLNLTVRALHSLPFYLHFSLDCYRSTPLLFINLIFSCIYTQLLTFAYGSHLDNVYNIHPFILAHLPLKIFSNSDSMITTFPKFMTPMCRFIHLSFSLVFISLWYFCTLACLDISLLDLFFFLYM